MSITAGIFIVIFVSFTIISLLKGPFWAVLLYIHVYFNMPTHQFWYNEVPDLRWSLTVLIILLASFFLHKERLSSRKFIGTLLAKEFMAIFFLVLLTSYFSPFPDVAWKATGLFLGYLLIFFILVKAIRSFDELVIILGWIVLETFQLSRLAHGRYTGGRLDGVGLPDAGSANLFGGLLVMVLPLLLPFLFSKDVKIRIIAIIIAPFVVNAFVMCGSRGSFLGLFVASLVILYSIFFMHGKELRKKTIFFLLTIAAGGFFILLSPDYKERIFSLTNQSVQDVSTGRIDIWRYAYKMSLDYPFGIGPAGFKELSPLYIPREFIEKEVGKRDAHNTYLLVLVELGYAGLLLYLFLIGTVLVGFYRSWKKLQLYRTDTVSMTGKLVQIEYVHVALLSSFVSFIVTIFFATRLYYEFIYIFLAITAVYFDLINEVTSQGKRA